MRGAGQSGLVASEARSSARLRSQRGFTLIEVVIAMAVSLFGLAGLMSLYITTVQANARATHVANASAIAQRVVEDLRSLPVQAPDPGYAGKTMEDLAGGPIGTATVTLVTRAEVASDNRSYTITVTARALGALGSPEQDLIFLRTLVTWADEGATDDAATDARLRHEIAFETLRTRQDVL